MYSLSKIVILFKENFTMRPVNSFFFQNVLKTLLCSVSVEFEAFLVIIIIH